jgi:Domain of unknown function (DUF4126)
MSVYNEPIVAVIVGLLLSVSAGFRIMLPLLAVNLLAYYHEITLPQDVAWLGSGPTLVVLAVGTLVETFVHFIPAAGTYLKAMATPLAFVAGTLLMAVPLGHQTPLYQWAIAGAVGGGAATLTHIGITGARAMTAPANVASLGMFGIVWNLGELFFSLMFAAVGWLCVFAGWMVGAAALLGLLIVAAIAAVKAFGHFTKQRAAAL